MKNIHTTFLLKKKHQLYFEIENKNISKYYLCILNILSKAKMY